MRFYDLTDQGTSELDKLIILMEEAWFLGCLTVSEEGGYYDQN